MPYFPRRALLTSLLAVFACSSVSSDPIIGRWNRVGKDSYSEFFADGKGFIDDDIATGSVTLSITWQRLDKERIRVEAMVFGVATGDVLATVLRNDTLTLTDSKGNVKRYSRSLAGAAPPATAPSPPPHGTATDLPTGSGPPPDGASESPPASSPPQFATVPDDADLTGYYLLDGALPKELEGFKHVSLSNYNVTGTPPFPRAPLTGEVRVGPSGWPLNNSWLDGQRLIFGTDVRQGYRFWFAGTFDTIADFTRLPSSRQILKGHLSKLTYPGPKILWTGEVYFRYVTGE